MSEIKLPPCGMFLGVPVYLDRGNYVFQQTGPFYTSWVSEDHDPEWYLRKCVEDNQGNMTEIWDEIASSVQLQTAAYMMDLEGIGVHVPEPDWKNGKYLTPEDLPELEKYRAERFGAGFYRFVKKAGELGLYCYSVYTDANPEWVKKICGLPNFLGYNAGENFTRESHDETEDENFNLEKSAESMKKHVKEYFENLRKKGWTRFFINSASFLLDSEIGAGGNDIIPYIEGMAFANLNFGMALCRGLYKQCRLPLWGCYLAHEHYAYLPFESPQRFQSLDAGYYLAYLNGAKMTEQESGSWWQQSDHIPDTPMHRVPKHDSGDISRNCPHEYFHLVEEAKKHYAELNYDSAVCRRYRKSVSDFYEFLKQNGTPDGQPEVNFAVLKGRNDFCSADYSPNIPVANAAAAAEKNAWWLEGQPERGWDIFRKVIFPLNDSYGEYKNLYFSGTPYGLCDIVSLNCQTDASFLSGNYKSLMFTGWNTAREEDYDLLKQYVKAGGTLFISLPHLAKNTDRNYVAWPFENLIHHGDFTELCGVKIKGRGGKYYWSLIQPGCEMPVRNPDTFKTKFGPFYTRLADLEITDDADVWATDDEQFRPVLIRHKYGKGEVLFLNSWEYPGALDKNEAPGANRFEQGMIGLIYRYMALKARGTVWITDDGIMPGRVCNDISYSYFPSRKIICFQNCNFRENRVFYVHTDSARKQITLKPHEFQMIPKNDIH